MKRIVIVGGGWAGCAAAVSAAKNKCEVLLLERTDMLLGTGLVGGIMRNNGRYTVTEEAMALGGGDLFYLIDSLARHRNIDFPGHKHATLYDVFTVEAAVREFLASLGIQLFFRTRITDVEMTETRILGVSTADDVDFFGDVFIDTTGTAGPIGNCTKYGNGCAMCVLRCNTFGGRVSLTAKVGVREIFGKQKDGSIGAMSGSCKILKESLAPAIVKELNQNGVCIIPIPTHLANESSLVKKACQQYALQEYAENIVLLDTGHAKLMASYFPLSELRAVPGMENARYEDPYSGGIGNSIRYMGMSPRNDALQVDGVDNLFCAGEKAGLLVGHTEAIVTGALAGYNAAQMAKGRDLLILPETLAVGNGIKFVRKEMESERGRMEKYTFSGSVLFDRMNKMNLYTTDRELIKKRVREADLVGIMEAG